VSRSHLRPDTGEFEIIRVLGPDEYHENVDNNVFTNYQARFAVSYALDVLELMEKERPSEMESLQKRLGIDEDEVDLWRRFIKSIHIPGPDADTGVIEQFKGFFDLEDIRPEELKKRLKDPGEYWGWPNGIAVETQVSKQADVMQLFALHPDLHDRQTVKANWEYYEPRTQHGSSLSPAVYAMTAAWVGHMEEAERYFWKAASVDLCNTNRAVSGGTFIGGIHTAACGALWQVVVSGFAGMKPIAGGYSFDPHIPRGWGRLSFALVYHGRRMTVSLSGRTVTVEAATANNDSIRITLGSESKEIGPGERAELGGVS
jgi:trehalose/maltose hydrolase-like predicted phosphorylase